MRERARGTERERASVFFSISNGTNATFVEQISLFFPLREREETTQRKRGYNLSNPLLESLLSHPDENENENDDDDDDATHHPPTFERKARRPSLLAQNRGGRRQERKIDRSIGAHHRKRRRRTSSKVFLFFVGTICVKEFCGRGGVSVRQKERQTDRPLLFFCTSTSGLFLVVVFKDAHVLDMMAI